MQHFEIEKEYVLKIGKELYAGTFVRSYEEGPLKDRRTILVFRSKNGQMKHIPEEYAFVLENKGKSMRKEHQNQAKKSRKTPPLSRSKPRGAILVTKGEQVMGDDPYGPTDDPYASPADPFTYRKDYK